MNKMRRYYRFLVEKELLENVTKEKAVLEIDKGQPELLHQLTKVLRLKRGDQMILLPVNREKFDGFEYSFSVESVQKNQVLLTLLQRTRGTDPLDRELGLALALPNKAAKLEEILQHCTELGVSHFILFSGDRSNFSHRLALPRLEKVIREAVEQSERIRLPSLGLYDNLDQYLENLERPCLVALERAPAQQSLLDMQIDRGCDLLVGPEGGFSEREIALVRAYQLRTYSLGKSILRNQTAAVLSVGIVSLKMQQ
jgi:16S rRNA (uracil1498-N3)-methyltransferase